MNFSLNLNHNGEGKIISEKCHRISSGPRLNIKTIFPRYGHSYVKDKTVGETVLSLTWELPYLVRPSFLLRRPPGIVLMYGKLAYQLGSHHGRDWLPDWSQGMGGSNWKFVMFIFQAINILNISCDIALGWIPDYRNDDKSALAQIMDNGLVPSSNKSLCEPMSNKVCDAIWHHWASMS